MKSLIIFLLLFAKACASPCVKRYFPSEDEDASFVCVCNSTYCDDIQPLINQSINQSIAANRAVIYTSDQAANRMTRSTLQWQNVTNTTVDVSIKLNPSIVYQRLYGFGGAFTDAAGIVMKSLPTEAQENLLKSYFGDMGLRYSLGRIPMASCDFSTREYSYDDVEGDFNLTKFGLAHEDLEFKIPLIKLALKLTGSRSFKLFASPWSAPGWMKTNGRMKGGAPLRGQVGGEYFVTWAKYFVKFIEAYSEHNITIWGITTQNEPSGGFIPDYPWQAMGFTAEMMRDFIINNLGPHLRSSGYGNIKVMIVDDSRAIVKHWADVIYNSSASEYVAGLGVHWYKDDKLPVGILQEVHQKYPEKFILATEACAGEGAKIIGPHLGSWKRAEAYAKDIIDDLNNWSTGWVDWNLALNMEGGPNWVGNYVDAPVIVNDKLGEFYKQPMFYALGHFSAFIPPKSQRIGAQADNSSIRMLAAVTPTRQRVVVLLNMLSSPQTVRLTTIDLPGNELLVTVTAKSITTIVMKKE